MPQGTTVELPGGFTLRGETTALHKALLGLGGDSRHPVDQPVVAARKALEEKDPALKAQMEIAEEVRRAEELRLLHVERAAKVAAEREARQATWTRWFEQELTTARRLVAEGGVQALDAALERRVREGWVRPQTADGIWEAVRREQVAAFYNDLGSGQLSPRQVGERVSTLLSVGLLRGGPAAAAESLKPYGWTLKHKGGTWHVFPLPTPQPGDRSHHVRRR